MYFNPRLREGGDIYPGSWETVSDYFNPRLREGGDTAYESIITQAENFNPRLREGGDAINVVRDAKINISIHASAKEATKNQYYR